MRPAATLNAPMMMRREGAACHGMAIGDGMEVSMYVPPCGLLLVWRGFGRMEEKRKLLLIVESTN
jgi:hypothetical protein